MSTPPRRTTRSAPGSTPPSRHHDSAEAVRAATPTVPDTAPENLSIGTSPGPIVGSVCTGYGGLDLGCPRRSTVAGSPGAPTPDPPARQRLALTPSGPTDTTQRGLAPKPATLRRGRRPVETVRQQTAGDGSTMRMPCRPRYGVSTTLGAPHGFSKREKQKEATSFQCSASYDPRHSP